MRNADDDLELFPPTDVPQLIKKLPTAEWGELIHRLQRKGNTFGMAISCDADINMRMVPDATDAEHLLLSAFVSAILNSDEDGMMSIMEAVQETHTRTRNKRHGRGTADPR